MRVPDYLRLVVRWLGPAAVLPVCITVVVFGDLLFSQLAKADVQVSLTLAQGRAAHVIRLGARGRPIELSIRLDTFTPLELRLGGQDLIGHRVLRLGSGTAAARVAHAFGQTLVRPAFHQPGRPRARKSSRTHRRNGPLPARRGEGAVARLARLGVPIYCGGRHGRAIALTFDDGPGIYTHLVLRLLRRDHAHATFFLVGRLLAGWPQMPARERALGALGDHTWTHPYLPGLPPTAIAGQLGDTQRAIAARAHVSVRLFRPPYGARNAMVDREARRLGMLEVLWNVDSLDWAGADPNGIARNVLRHLSPGAIVLMHENRGQTIKALKYLVLPALRRLHYRLVSVPELLAFDPPSTAQLHRGLSGCSKNTPPPRRSGA